MRRGFQWGGVREGGAPRMQGVRGGLRHSFLFLPQKVERKYWRTVGMRPPLYGADIHASLFHKDCKV